MQVSNGENNKSTARRECNINVIMVSSELHLAVFIV